MLRRMTVATLSVLFVVSMGCGEKKAPEKAPEKAATQAEKPASEAAQPDETPAPEAQAQKEPTEVENEKDVATEKIDVASTSPADAASGGEPEAPKPEAAVAPETEKSAKGDEVVVAPEAAAGGDAEEEAEARVDAEAKEKVAQESGEEQAEDQPSVGEAPTAEEAAVKGEAAVEEAPAGGVGEGEPATAADGTWTPPPFQNVDEDKWDVRRRAQMVQNLTSGYRHKITDENVLRAMGNIPRHMFMLPEDRENGYKQMWYRIGYGQTITDPGMVAWMTQLIAVKPTDKVLEIGTGSGYQGTVLSQLTPHTYTIEIVEKLAKRTHGLLEKLGYMGVIHTRIGDGYFGWEEEAPFDKIIVTCAADHIPVPLIQQLKPGGLMVIPVGPRFQPGKLYFISKDEEGRVHEKVMATVSFVPMTRLKAPKEK